MRRIPILIAGLFATLLGSTSALGWYDTGHRIIADIAWAELTPAARTWAADTLKEHPRYQEDLLRDKPDGTSDAESARYGFVTAATWPDMVRDLSDPMHSRYSHPAWHYIDIPYCLAGQAATTRAASEPAGPKDIVEALTKNVAELKNPAVSAADKAIALCWVLHLCGDIHQPLHACDMFSPQFPNGDAGGNSFMILTYPRYSTTQTNLHSVWDALPGDFQSREIEQYIAAGLRGDPQYSREKLKPLLAVTDFSAWANESHALAVKYAYADGQLRGLAKHASLAPGTITPGLTHDYLRDAEHVADHQLVLAGYRTADLVNAIFNVAAQQVHDR